MTTIEPEFARFRSPSKGVRLLTRLLLIALPLVGVFFIMDFPSYLGWAVLREQYYGIVLAIVLACVFLLAPATKKAARNGLWYDAILSVWIGLPHVAILHPEIFRLGIITRQGHCGHHGHLFILEGRASQAGFCPSSACCSFSMPASLGWLLVCSRAQVSLGTSSLTPCIWTLTQCWAFQWRSALSLSSPTSFSATCCLVLEEGNSLPTLL
jgi:hypothetical protein